MADLQDDTTPTASGNHAGNRTVHFSSQRMDWQTPKAVYQMLDAEFSFDHDPTPANWDGVTNGLTSDWGKSNFVNPPYGRELPKFVAKGYEEWNKGKTVVFLIPSRTDTRWWHDYCMKATEIRFIKGRLKFDGHSNSAPFPSCLVIFKASTKCIDMLATNPKPSTGSSDAPQNNTPPTGRKV